MKNIKYTLFLALFLVGFSLTAQSLDQGQIKMEITEVNSDNEQMAAQLEMLKGSVTEYSFNKEKSLVTAEMMGGMVKMRTLVNNADEQMTMLFDAMGNKMMVESTKEERKELDTTAEEMGLKISYDDADSKDILGYKCVKANVTGSESSPMEFSMYVAKDIKASNKMILGLQNIDLRGFPLEYIMKVGEMSMTYSAVELKKEVDPSIFELNTSGFTKLTFEEFQAQMGAMGGGMGF